LGERQPFQNASTTSIEPVWQKQRNKFIFMTTTVSLVAIFCYPDENGGEKMNETGYSLPANIKFVWRADIFIWSFNFFVVGLLLLIASHFWHWPSWLGLGVIGLTVLQYIIRRVLVSYRYRFLRYNITPTAVFLQKGFFFRKNEAIPIARIQNVTLEQGPLLRWQQLQQVNIETASTAHVIDGVTASVANQLRTQILKLAQEARDE